MSDVEMDGLVDTRVCVKCSGEKTGEWLEQVDKYTYYKLWLTMQNNQA